MRALIGLLLMFQCSQSFGLEKSLLWRITSPGNPTASYLFGTVHVICEEDYIWTDAMQRRFDSSKAICFEMNLDDPGLMTEAAMKLIDFTGKTLHDYVRSESDYQILRSFIKDSLKQDLTYAESLKPIGLYFLYTTLSIQAPCKGNTSSYEVTLLQQAKDAKKKIEGLETLQDQLTAIEAIPTDSILQTLIRAAKGARESMEETAQMIAAYKKQDLGKMQEMMSSSKEAGMSDQQTMDKLLHDRNRKWMTPMQQLMNTQSTFFAVGAGHLPGLIKLLRDSGFRVEPI
jgi:uncharacterized protein YbaP (TraB family)